MWPGHESHATQHTKTCNILHSPRPADLLKSVRGQIFHFVLVTVPWISKCMFHCNHKQKILKQTIFYYHILLHYKLSSHQRFLGNSDNTIENEKNYSLIHFNFNFKKHFVSHQFCINKCFNSDYGVWILKAWLSLIKYRLLSWRWESSLP